MQESQALLRPCMQGARLVRSPFMLSSSAYWLSRPASSCMFSGDMGLLLFTLTCRCKPPSCNTMQRRESLGQGGAHHIAIHCTVRERSVICQTFDIGKLP